MKYFPYEVKTTTIAPWNESLFKVDKRSKRLDEERRGVFHTFFMKCMFFCKKGRPDIPPGVGFMSSQVK